MSAASMVPWLGVDYGPTGSGPCRRDGQPGTIVSAYRAVESLVAFGAPTNHGTQPFTA